MKCHKPNCRIFKIKFQRIGGCGQDRDLAKFSIEIYQKGGNAESPKINWFRVGFKVQRNHSFLEEDIRDVLYASISTLVSDGTFVYDLRQQLVLRFVPRNTLTYEQNKLIEIAKTYRDGVLNCHGHCSNTRATRQAARMEDLCNILRGKMFCNKNKVDQESWNRRDKLCQNKEIAVLFHGTL